MATEVVVTGRQSDEQEGSSVKYVKESEEKRKVSLWDDFDEEVENEKMLHPQSQKWTSSF